MQQIFDPRTSVLFRESLNDLSPKLILVAEVDILYDEQILYHKRFLDEGVRGRLTCQPATHPTGRVKRGPGGPLIGHKLDTGWQGRLGAR